MRNIIITGGETFNKGAQAMVFIAVDEMKKRFPEHEIYVLSDMDLRRPKKEREQYAFRFMGWYPIKFAKAQRNPALRMLCKIRNGEELAQTEAIYRNCDLVVDVSGYALGSNWDGNVLARYTEHLAYAYYFKIPVYLMPQSFGPFDFNDDQKKYDKAIRKYLPHVKMICARENSGMAQLREHYALKNVCLLPDLVLNNRSVLPEHIFSQAHKTREYSIEKNSVGIVPNKRLLDTFSEEQLQELYREIISKILSEGKNVYVVFHASADGALCKKLKELFPTESKVQLVEDEINSIEFSEIVIQFEFIIASRYHAVVHALKCGVPCITIGWADKYKALMEQFGMGRYCFDCRVGINAAAVCETIDILEKSTADESKKIMEHLSKVQSQNVFDVISL